MAVEDNVPAAEGTTQPQPEVGRAAVLAKWKAANPDGGEPTEEQLWETARENYDGLKGRYDKVMEGQKGLHDYVSKDPRFGAAIGMSFGEGEDRVPFTQALGRLYGPDAFSDSEDFAKGVAEYQEAQAQSAKEQEEAQRNFSESLIRFEKFVSDNELSEDEGKKLYEGILSLAESFLMGDIPDSIIDMIHKGITYDKDVQEAADTGFVQGKNENVRAEMKKKTEPSSIPDLGSGTGSGKNRIAPKKRTGKSYYEDMEEVKL